MMTIFLTTLFLYLYFSTAVVVANLYQPTSGVPTFKEQRQQDKRQPVLILDIDGTLYDDDCKIETQIAEGCFLFASQFGYSIEESKFLASIIIHIQSSHR
jgi:hypothetical protein